MTRKRRSPGFTTDRYTQSKAKGGWRMAALVREAVASYLALTASSLLYMMPKWSWYFRSYTPVGCVQYCAVRDHPTNAALRRITPFLQLICTGPGRPTLWGSVCTRRCSHGVRVVDHTRVVNSPSERFTTSSSKYELLSRVLATSQKQIQSGLRRVWRSVHGNGAAEFGSSGGSL
jgi:hypothetical protein